MDLPSKALRDSYGIDSFERAVVWSALLLRSAYQASDSAIVKDAVQSTLQMTGTGERFTQNIIVRAMLLLDNKSLPQAANLVSNIAERFTGTVTWEGGTSPQSIGAFTPITADPFALSLEQYFFWACQNVLKENVEDYKKIQIIPVYKGVSNPFDVNCTVQIPFDYATYLTTNNLITAIGAKDIPVVVTANFGNFTQLNNLFQIAN